MSTKLPGWPDRGGWYAIALFVQTIMIFNMIAFFPELRQDEFFKNLATAIVITGWIGFAVGQAKGEKERDNTAKALDVAKAQGPSVTTTTTSTTAPSPTDQVNIDADNVKVTKK